MLRPISFFLLFAIVGCAGSSRQGVPAAATEFPITTIPALRMADAVDLGKLNLGDGEVQLTSKLQLSRGGTIYFGEIDTYDADDQVDSSVPLIARLQSGHWKMLPIDDVRLHDASWSYVGAGPHHGEIWGMLDRSLNEKQPELVIAHSTDGGASFALTALHKPNEVADFDSFCLGPEGRGRLTLFASAADESVDRPGFYHYRTTDGGRTWSGPTYEPDAMSPGQDVGDDEQPDTKAKSVQPASVVSRAQRSRR